MADDLGRRPSADGKYGQKQGLGFFANHHVYRRMDADGEVDITEPSSYGAGEQYGIDASRTNSPAGVGTPAISITSPTSTDRLSMNDGVPKPAARPSRFAELFQRTLSSSWGDSGRRVADDGTARESKEPKRSSGSGSFPIRSSFEANTEYDAGRASMQDMDESSVRHFGSGVMMVLAIYEPRYHKKVASRSGALSQATASLITAVVAKLVEISFVTVFVAFLGQVLTRRAFAKESKGMTLAEMLMRNWIIQPGTLWTHFGLLSKNIHLLGCLTLLATVFSTLYTSASDAMVTPKLTFGDWERRELLGLVYTSYANPLFATMTCTTPTAIEDDSDARGHSCLDVQYSGQSYRNLLAFMKTWDDLGKNGSDVGDDIRQRPVGTALLFDNTTLYASWIEKEYSNVTANYASLGRIVDNVTLAIPHPAVYKAARHPINDIMQPTELDGVGEYNVKASVVSPAVNVLCVNMAKNELDPLVYTAWPEARTDTTEYAGQLKPANSTWEEDVPRFGVSEWLNATVVDHVFKWGLKYGRRPPVFPMYPIPHNMVVNSSVYWGDAIYILAHPSHKGRTLARGYTVCELRSFTVGQCSTQFNISGTTGARMKASCDEDEDSYLRSVPDYPIRLLGDGDWTQIAHQWRISMDMNGGMVNNNASNARILTSLSLQDAHFPPNLPSMAEALAVYASATLVTSSLDSTFRHYWGYNETMMDPPMLEAFNATMRVQMYASTHANSWQNVFLVPLVSVFLLSLLCLLYQLLFWAGTVTDYTEPSNLFALALNSPPSRQLAGSCGGGPEGRELLQPWRVGYASPSNHYFFAEANDGPWREKAADRDRHLRDSTASAARLLADGSYSKNYKRLSAGRTFL